MAAPNHDAVCDQLRAIRDALDSEVDLDSIRIRNAMAYINKAVSALRGCPHKNCTVNSVDMGPYRHGDTHGPWKVCCRDCGKSNVCEWQ